MVIGWGALLVMGSEPHAFSDEELQSLTDLCRLAEEELADIELTRLLKLAIGSQARMRAVMDASIEGPVNRIFDEPDEFRRRILQAPGARERLRVS